MTFLLQCLGADLQGGVANFPAAYGTPSLSPAADTDNIRTGSRGSSDASQTGAKHMQAPAYFKQSATSASSASSAIPLSQQRGPRLRRDTALMRPPSRPLYGTRQSNNGQCDTMYYLRGYYFIARVYVDLPFLARRETSTATTRTVWIRVSRMCSENRWHCLLILMRARIR